jgi:hypothetical protein
VRTDGDRALLTNLLERIRGLGAAATA